MTLLSTLALGVDRGIRHSAVQDLILGHQHMDLLGQKYKQGSAHILVLNNKVGINSSHSVLVHNYFAANISRVLASSYEERLSLWLARDARQACTAIPLPRICSCVC